MTIEDEQLPAAETAEIAEGEESQVDESASSEETEEQRNERLQSEAAEKARQKEERKQANIQKRINEITAEKHSFKAVAEQQAQQIERLLAVIEGRKTEPKSTDGEPKRDQFEDYEDFVTARAEYRAEQKALAIIEKKTAEQNEQRSRYEQETARETTERQFVDRQAAARKELPDYDEVVQDWEPNVPDTVQEMIVRLDQGPLICYHLAKNPELEAQFRKQPPYMHGVLIGQIIASLKGSQKVTAAPAPGRPVGNKSMPVDSDSYTGPAEGYYAWARKQEKAGKLR